MKIVVFDLDSCDSRDIEPLLRSFADSEDRLTAAKGQMLLDLVLHIHAAGPGPQLIGCQVFDELWIRELGNFSQAQVKIGVDWYDFCPLENSLPQMHFRINVRQSEQALSHDIRTPDLACVERALRDVFRRDS